MITLGKQEEKFLFCFAMNESIVVDIELADFETIKGYKLFNLQRIKVRRTRIPIRQNVANRFEFHSMIYARMASDNAGLRVLFYCKKLLIDDAGSWVRYIYQKPSAFAATIPEIIGSSVPYVLERKLKQKIYILPGVEDADGLASDMQQLHATLNGQFKQVDCRKMDTNVAGTNMELRLQRNDSQYWQAFSYVTNTYLATPDEAIYTKVTSVSPYFIMAN